MASSHVPQRGAGARFCACKAGLRHQAQAFPVFQVQGSERKGREEEKGIKKLSLPRAPVNRDMGTEAEPHGDEGSIHWAKAGGQGGAAPGMAVGLDFCLLSTKSSLEDCKAPSTTVIACPQVTQSPKSPRGAPSKVPALGPAHPKGQISPPKAAEKQISRVWQF